MPVFDFSQQAGASILSPGDDDGSVSFSERNRRVAARLTEWVAQSGARTDHITITFDALERRVVLSGRVSSQSEREIVVLVVGNSRGVAQVDDQLVVDDGDPISTFYTVVAGDTLAKIARAQLGDPMKYHAIFDANRPMLKDPDLIYPGQVLRLPASSRSSAG